jgi:trimethylamine---corrinoid protein Co-methyltransferase
MERDYFYPSLADRDEPRTWAEKGAQDAWSRARHRAQEILRDHRPSYLTPQQDREIRAQFKIL